MNARLNNIKKEVIRQLHEGKWQKEAAEYVADNKKMKTLLAAVLYFFKKRSLGPVLKDVILLYYYVKDIVEGKYKAYNYKKLIMIVAVLLYVVSPLDLVPDFLAGLGLLDDVALITYALHLADKELHSYFSWCKTSSVKNSSKEI